MRVLTFGTSNPAKIAQIAGVLSLKGIEVVGLEGRKIDVAEDGATAEENARKKAATYAAALGAVVLSMDNALFIDGFPDEFQPGIHVRRINGRDAASDEELIEHFTQLASEKGGELSVRWHFALAIAGPGGIVAEKTVVTPPRRMVSVLCAGRQPGYPLESLQIDPETGKYVAEMSPDEQDRFWRRTIGEEIAGFVDNALMGMGQ